MGAALWSRCAVLRRGAGAREHHLRPAGPYTGVADGRVVFWDGERWVPFAMAFPCWTQELHGGPKASPLEYLPASISATARSGSVSIRLGTCTSPTPTSACSKSAARPGWPRCSQRRPRACASTSPTTSTSTSTTRATSTSLTLAFTTKDLVGTDQRARCYPRMIV
ncbi:Noc2p family [Zea mays]|uniref:Noc2p family n=1 Tax=Zea mays TaxID=4577 RepID=A0A1D6JSB9_MAIZE|nr:Noc2p family [Zea mays]ONL94824.1 Noc2p family [Zea mays]